MTTTPPGWYPAPDSSGRQQWWNGIEWSDQFAPTQPVVQHPVAPQPVTQTPQYAQQPQYQQPQYAQQPQKSGKGWLWIVLGVVAVVVIGGIIGVIALVGVVASSVSSLNQNYDEVMDALEPADEYQIEDRPGWDPLVARYQDTYDKYISMSADEMLTIIPTSTEGISYYKDFLYILTDQKGALTFMDGYRSSTDPQELDDTIAYMDKELTELERKFLAGEDFGVSIKITQSDGTVYESDGTFPTIDVPGAVTFVAGYNGQPDASGSYLRAAQELADQFGIYLTWVPGTNESDCTSGDSTAGYSTLAYYCSLNPQLIYLNSLVLDVNDVDLLNTVRHELAHHVINLACSTGSPVVAGALPEAVTNSYARLYLGADDTIDDYSPEQYVMSAATDAAAEAIHGGDCG